MTSNANNFVANRDTILKEGWFKKRNFKGEIGRAYSKRWVVLTQRYFEWFDCPNGNRKNTIPLDHAYARIHEGTGLIVGNFQNAKEWLLRDEGSSPAATVAEWLEAINKAIENYRNVGGSTAASATGQKGLVPLAEVLGKNAQTQANVQNQAAMQNTSMLATVAPPAAAPAPVYNTPAPSPFANPAPAPAPVPTFTPQPVYNAPAPMATTSVQTTNFGYAPQPTYSAPQPAYTTTTFAAPQPMATTTYVQQPMMVQQPVMTTTYVQQQPTFVTTNVIQHPTMTYTTYNPMY